MRERIATEGDDEHAGARRRYSFRAPGLRTDRWTMSSDANFGYRNESRRSGRRLATPQGRNANDRAQGGTELPAHRGVGKCSNRSMGLGAIGPELSGTSLSGIAGSIFPAALATRLIAGTAETLGDSVATLLTDLSGADIDKLIALLERPLPALDSTRLQDLLRTIISSAAEGDANGALSALREIAALDPLRAETLRTDPAIGSIQASVDQLLDHHTLLVKLDAEGRLAEAAPPTGPAAAEKLTGWDMSPATMAVIANRLLDSGGLVNYVHAAELAQLVIDGSRWVLGDVSLPPAAPQLARVESRDTAQQPGGTVRQAERHTRGKMSARLGVLWLRAPLLILLLSWLLLGVTGGVGFLLWRRFSPETWPGLLVAIAFDVWGTGFLALVAFGFYARVRNVRF